MKQVNMNIILRVTWHIRPLVAISDVHSAILGAGREIYLTVTTVARVAMLQDLVAMVR